MPKVFRGNVTPKPKSVTAKPNKSNVTVKLHKEITVTCSACGNSMITYRRNADGKYHCSPACKQKLYREKKKAQKYGNSPGT